MNFLIINSKSIKCEFFWLNKTVTYSWKSSSLIALSAGAVEYTGCISAEE